MFIKLESPSTFLVTGSSQSGKTTWIKRLIEHRREMFKIPPVKVKYIYKIQQPLFEDLKALGVEFHCSLPCREELEEWTESGDSLLLILDDVMQEACASPDILSLFTVISHHRNVTTCFLMQNIFPRGLHARSISLNAHYIVIFKTKRDRLQVQTLGRQIFPGLAKYFAEAYEDATNENYNYLFCDLHPATDKRFELRTRIFPGEDTWFYSPIKAGEKPGTYSFVI